MDISIQDELPSFVEKLQRYISPLFLEELARKIGFIKRKRNFSCSNLATIFRVISLDNHVTEPYTLLDLL